MSLSGPVRPMHQDTYAYLKNNVGKSFIDILLLSYIARDTWSETMIVDKIAKFWIPGSFIIYGANATSILVWTRVRILVRPPPI